MVNSGLFNTSVLTCCFEFTQPRKKHAYFSGFGSRNKLIKVDKSAVILFDWKARSVVDITRWREDMNFMFEWQEQYLTSERSERERYCKNIIKFISSSQRVMFLLLYGD